MSIVVRKTKSMLKRLAVTATLIVGSGAAAKVAHATVPEPFVVFNDTHFANFRLLDTAGAMRSTVVYDSWSMSCSTTSCSNIPSESTFQTKLQADVNGTTGGGTGAGNSFLIVLDFEDLVVDKATSQAQADQDKAVLMQFASWVYAIYPTARLALYDYDYSTAYQSTRAQLYGTGGYTAFAPSLYQRWSSYATWETNMNSAVTNDKAISSSLPIYPFISPYVGGSVSEGWVSADEWLEELDDLIASANGAIIWTQTASDTTTILTTDSWYSELVGVMSPQLNTSYTYYLKNEHTGYCAQVAATAGSSVLQVACLSPETTVQEWSLVSTSQDTFYLTNAGSSSLYLSVAGGLTAAGTGVELDSAGSTTPTAGQTWHVVSGGNGYYVLIGDGSNKCLEASTAGSGAQIIVDNCAITSSQLFSFRHVSN